MAAGPLPDWCGLAPAIVRPPLAFIAREASADHGIGFRRIGLGQHDAWMFAKRLQSAFIGPEPRTPRQRRPHDFRPAGQRGLADLIAAQRPEHGARRASTGRRPFADPVQIAETRHAKSFHQGRPLHAFQAFHRIERPMQRNILWPISHARKLVPGRGAEGLKNRHETAKTCLSSIGVRQADRKIEAEQDTSTGAVRERGVKKCRA